MRDIYARIKENPTTVGDAFAAMNMNERDLFKHSLIIPLHMDLQNYEEKGIVTKQTGYLFTYFRNSEAPYFYTFT